MTLRPRGRRCPVLAGLLAWILALSLGAPALWACVTCQPGTTLPVPAGDGLPVGSGMHALVEARAQQVRWDGPLRTGRLQDLRTDLAVMGRLGPAWGLSLGLPLVLRSTEDAGGGRQTVRGPGDATLQGDAGGWLVKDRLRGSLLAGLRVPLAPRWDDADGASLPLDLQTGLGRWMPVAGVSLQAWRGRWQTQTVASVAAPVGRVRWGQTPSTQVQASHRTERMWLAGRLATGVGVDVRWEDAVRNAGVPDPTTRGALVALSPQLTWQPTGGWWSVWVAARVPLVHTMDDGRREGPVTVLGARWSPGLRPAPTQAPGAGLVAAR
jgi:hypothetical protein